MSDIRTNPLKSMNSYQSRQDAEKALEDALIEVSSLRDKDGNLINTGGIIVKIVSAHTYLVEDSGSVSKD